jgi:linoleoyl-CoA desaturase
MLHILSGNLGFQIEHHLFPDLPSNRYAEIAVKVRALCEKYDIPYTTGPLHRQYGQALRTIIKLSLPNRMTSSDQPEPPTPSRDRKRRTDDERPSRRRELGGWMRSAS